MNSRDTKRSSEQLRKDVLVQLDKVDADIDQMEMRLTPGQFIDDIIYYPRGGNPAATFDLLKENPVGTTFLTLGTLMLMENEHHQTYEQVGRSRVSGLVRDSKSRVNEAVDQGRDTVHDKITELKGKVDRVKSRFHRSGDDSQDSSQGMMDQAREKLNDVKQDIQTKFENVKDDVQDKISGNDDHKNEISFDGYSNDYSQPEDINRRRAIEDAKVAFSKDDSGSSSSTSDIKKKMSEGVQDLKSKLPDSSRVKGQVQSAISSAKEQVSGASESIKSNISESAQQGISAVKGMDPLTYVAVGAGLGALTGIALPVPETEQGMVDDRLDGTISSFTEDLQSALNESAGILKDLVVSDLKSFNVDVFKR